MKEIEKMTLEDAMKELEGIVEKLDDSKLSLEKSMDAFEQGIKLVTHCRKLLDGYSKRITVLKKEGALLKESPMEESFDA